MPNVMKRLFLAEPLGFCGGVRRALEMFNRIVAEHPDCPVYVLHELVHNSTVTNAMKLKNAVFVDRLGDVPSEAVTLFGAHGISPAIEREAIRRKLRYYDAVCPLVSRLQATAEKAPEDLPLIFYGDVQHPEVQSVLGRVASPRVFILEKLEDAFKLPPLEKALFLCQTTRNHEQVLKIAETLRKRIPGLIDKSAVCDAVSRRQKAVAELSNKCELMLIISSPHSSNGLRMLGIAQEKCSNAFMVNNGDDVTGNLLAGVSNVGVGAATSTPDYVITAVIDKLKSFGFVVESNDSL